MQQQDLFAGWFDGKLKTKGRKREPLSPEGQRKAEAIAADMLADEELQAAFNDAYAALNKGLDDYFAEHFTITHAC